MEELRIHKFLADAGIMSRRAAEEAVKRGEVKVNGETAELGMKIDPESDKVQYKGNTVTLNKKRHDYIILHKPVGYVTTMSDEKGRKTVKDLVSDIGVRVYPVGRLDLNSEGLLIMTNDGEMANSLMHPAYEKNKKYIVVVDGDIKNIYKLSESMDIDGYVISPATVNVVSNNGSISTLEITIHEGRNRQIRKMCDIAGFSVKSLKRVSVGKLELGDLPKGKWRYLTEKEVELLKE